MAEAIEVLEIRTGVEMPEIRRVSKWHLLHEALRNGPMNETFEIDFGASERNEADNASLSLREYAASKLDINLKLRVGPSTQDEERWSVFALKTTKKKAKKAG